MRRRLSAIAAVALLLAGCSADAEPAPTPSTEAPTTEPTTDAPTPPAVDPPSPPPEITNHDVSGAGAAAQYFLSLYPYVYATGDLEEWRAMSHPECNFCNSVIENATALHAAGGYRTGGDMTIEIAEAHPPIEGNDYYAVWLNVSEGPSAQFSDGTAQADEKTGGERVAMIALTDLSGEWIIRGVEVNDP